MSDGRRPICPRCSSANVERHAQPFPARPYWTCSDCGKAGDETKFVPPAPVPRRRGLSRGAAMAYAMLVAADERFSDTLGVVKDVDRADRRRTR